ncbi:MAG TPA: serine/threonine-protein kinase [Gaiellaceae bacterium]|nr:serine/threonine-protein kinase [Gaiellaceae bacterium]
MASKRRGASDWSGRLGPYRLEEVLGEGRMGVVYRAVRDADGAVVALKVLRRELSDDHAYVRRFEREGEIASGLDHPHLVPVVDRGNAEGRRFLAARYVRGRSLAERLGESPLVPLELARVVAHVGSALDELHRRGLVHRDVKPANILLDERDAAVLTDFGVARGAADSTLTRIGRVVGTVDYLAPEVIRGSSATAASDIYSLGCVAYECAVGRPPFGERSVPEACAAHLREPPPDPGSLNPDLPAALVRALLTALAKDPARRPATGAAYGRLLLAAAKGG